MLGMHLYITWTITQLKKYKILQPEPDNRRVFALAVFLNVVSLHYCTMLAAKQTNSRENIESCSGTNKHNERRNRHNVGDIHVFSISDYFTQVLYMLTFHLSCRQAYISEVKRIEIESKILKVVVNLQTKKPN